MAIGRSFSEYVKYKCYDRLFEIAEEYVRDNLASLYLHTGHIRKIGDVEISDATIQRVYIRDLPGMRVGFGVGLELELSIKEGDYHYDEIETEYPWIRISCEGDLSCGLDDWKIINITPDDPDSAPANSLSDALVPYIPFDRLEDTATDFLNEDDLNSLKTASI